MVWIRRPKGRFIRGSNRVSFLTGTLNELTLSSNSRHAIKGHVTQTLSTISLTGRGVSVGIRSGAVNKPLSSLLLSSTSKFGIRASVSKTLNSSTLTSNSKLAIKATLNKSLLSTSLSSISHSGRVATVSKTLATVSLSSAGNAGRVATVNKTLSTVLLSSASKLAIRASLSKTLVNISLDSSGTSSVVTYDTAVGNGVDSSGFASLPLRAGATRYYVGSGGNDANTGLSHSQRFATVQHAADIVSLTAGDQILVAEGTTVSTGFPDIRGTSGFSKVYPFVVQSYDPVDPTNEAKIGRATGSNRPIFNKSSDTQNFVWGSGAMKFVAMRGFQFNADSTTWKYIALNVPGSGTNDYILVENCIFHYTMLSSDQSQGAAGNGARANKFILRNSALYAGEQGFYIAATEGVTIEDNVFWHNGWVPGAARTDTPPTGPSQFEHAIYAQANCTTNCVRRNIFIDTASDGGNIKGGGLYQDNLGLRNPIAASIGSGNQYSVMKPFGSWIDLSYNAFVGSGLIQDSSAQGWGITSNDGRSSSCAQIHHNVLARNDYALTNGAYISQNRGDPDSGDFLIPDNTNYHHNVSYLWNNSGATVNFSGSTPATYDHAIWDDPTSGTSTNNGSVSFANAYTLSGLVTALGYASETAMINDFIANPEKHKWRVGAQLMLAGYGVTKAQSDLATDMRLTIGISSTGMFIGTLDGYNLSSATLPSGVTLDSDGRRWIYDGTGTTGSGTATITESNGVNSHNSSIAWARYAQPVLSSLSVTPSTTSASVNVSTNVGSGKIYVIADTAATASIWPQIRAGYIANDTAAISSKSATVTATGAQSAISLTGLIHAVTYHLQIIQLDANNNPSVVSTTTFTTT